MAKFCGICGNPIDENMKFCAKCGAMVTDNDNNQQIQSNGIPEQSVDSAIQTSEKPKTKKNKTKGKKILCICIVLIIVLSIAAEICVFLKKFANIEPDISAEYGFSSEKHHKVGDKIQFGLYPQTKVTDEAIIKALDDMDKQWISYGYYYTSDAGTNVTPYGLAQKSDYMKYCDVEYNGEKYRGVYFDTYRPSYIGGKSTCQDDNEYYVNTTYWFEYEPLVWRILDPSEGFVMCTKAIDSQAYQDFVYSYNSIRYYNSQSCNNYASDWGTSSIREWLNNDFFNTAFNSTEKSQISTTYNENKSSMSSNFDSANTADKIFLLSYSEVLNSKYGFRSKFSTHDTLRQIKLTDYTQCQGCSRGDSPNGSCWWLRSPHYDRSATMVSDLGSVSLDGSVERTDIGIVPAFKFNPKSSASGN